MRGCGGVSERMGAASVVVVAVKKEGKSGERVVETTRNNTHLGEFCDGEGAVGLGAARAARWVVALSARRNICTAMSASGAQARVLSAFAFEGSVGERVTVLRLLRQV